MIKCLCASFTPACANCCLPTIPVHFKSLFLNILLRTLARLSPRQSSVLSNQGSQESPQHSFMVPVPQSTCTNPSKRVELLFHSTLPSQRARNMEDISQGHCKNTINITSLLVKIQLHPTTTKEILDTSSLIIFSTKDMKKKTMTCVRKGLSSCSSSTHNGISPQL